MSAASPDRAVPAEVAPSGIDLEGDDTARDAELAIIDKRIRLRAALARAAISRVEPDGRARR